MYWIQIKSEQISRDATVKFLEERKSWKTTTIINLLLEKQSDPWSNAAASKKTKYLTLEKKYDLHNWYL